METIMKKTLTAISIIFAIAVSGTAAQARGETHDLIIINNGDGSDFFEAMGFGRFWRYLDL